MQGPQLPNTSIRPIPRPPPFPPQVPLPKSSFLSPIQTWPLALCPFVAPFLPDHTLPSPKPFPSSSFIPPPKIYSQTPPLLWCLFFVLFALFNFYQLQLQLHSASHPFALNFKTSLSPLLKQRTPYPILLPNKQVPFLNTPPAAATPL